MNTNAIEIVVREIPNDDAALCSLLGEDERAYLSKLSDARRREWTAWRATLRSQAERWALSDSALRVAYAPSGEPLFVGLEGSISVTHSRRYVALARAWEGRCGIDIEQLNRNYERIEDKYISTTEKALATAHNERFLAVVWCAKEAAYKF
ncbi:MAG: 4'-phosphopantetheinyl transferase superfamily protein [Rikenellaceae bacterium]|nr:4'-phosphopantetheinyl transferase superfamily protein [Rikenellaceae bacterium]